MRLTPDKEKAIRKWNEDKSILFFDKDGGLHWSAIATLLAEIDALRKERDELAVRLQLMTPDLLNETIKGLLGSKKTPKSP